MLHKIFLVDGFVTNDDTYIIHGIQAASLLQANCIYMGNLIGIPNEQIRDKEVRLFQFNISLN